MSSSSTSAAPLSSEVAALVLSGAGADETEEGGDEVVMPVVNEAVAVAPADDEEEETELVAVRTVCDATLARDAGIEVVIGEPEYTAPPALLAAAAFVTPFWPLHCALLKSMLRVTNIR